MITIILALVALFFFIPSSQAASDGDFSAATYFLVTSFYSAYLSISSMNRVRDNLEKENKDLKARLAATASWSADLFIDAFTRAREEGK